MAINLLTNNYSGRKIDLHIMQGVKAPNNSVITPSFGKISNFCSGVQKLVQRFTIALLTEIGSQEDFPTFGSNLITNLTSTSNVYNRTDLFNLFSIASSKVLTDFQDYQSSNDTLDDESLSGVALEQITQTTTGGVAVKIRLITVAGESVDFIVPLPI